MIQIFILLLNFLQLVQVPEHQLALSANVRTSSQDCFTGKKWYMQEIRFLHDNIPYYYNREDRSENNMNFDEDFISFERGGKGMYHETNGNEYELTWEYKGESKNAIQFSIRNFRDDADLNVTWEKIQATDTYIRYTEYYTHRNGTHSLADATRVQRDHHAELVSR